ncbi:hypothetical protein ACHAXM_011633 [Skeletonema potamos]
MDFTEAVETVLPAGYTITKKSKKASSSPADSGSSSRSTDKGISSEKGSSGGGGGSSSKSKRGLFSRFNTKKTPKTNTTSAPPDSRKKTNTAASKKTTEDRRDTKEAPHSSEPKREDSQAPPTDCSLTDESADSQPKLVDDNDDSTIIDTTSLYGKIIGVTSPKKSNNEEVNEEKAATPVESLMSANAALVRAQSGISVSSETSTSSKRSIVSKKSVKSEPTEQDTEPATPDLALVRGQSGVSVSSKTSTSSKRRFSSKKSLKSEQTQETEEEVTLVQEEIVEQAQGEENFVAKQEEVLAAGHTWAKNISLKVGGFETSFNMADPVATMVNKVMNGLDSELVKQAKAMEYKEEERDYDENPTKLFLLLQQKAWRLAVIQLENHPEEAEVWVYRKFVPEKAPNVHDASDLDKSQALVIQTTALSTVVKKPAKYRWRLLPLHASIVLGAPQEVTTKILHTYPEAARKVDEQGSLPVHLAASRLDVDKEGEKVVLQLFAVYTDSIDIKDRRGRTAPELAKLARARKAAEKQRLMETASRTSGACIETSVSRNWREEEEEDNDDNRSVKSSFSTRFRNMMKGSKSMDRGDKKRSIGGDVENAVSNVDDDSIVADMEGMAPGFAFLTAAKSTDEREAQTIANEVSKANSVEHISEEYKTSADGLTAIPTEALELPLPASKSFGEGSDRPPKSASMAADSDETSVVSAVVRSIADSNDSQSTLRALLEKACENAGRPGMDVTKFLAVLEEEWVTDVEAIRRLDVATLDSILPIMLSRELQRLVNHSNSVDGEYLKRSRGRRRDKPSKFAKKKTKKRSARRKPASRLHLPPIHEEYNTNGNETFPITEEEDETTEDDTVTDNTDDHVSSASCTEEGTVEEDEMRKNHAALVFEARNRFPTREALEDAIRERQATVSLAVGSGFDVDKQTLAQAALADDEVRKLLPLRLVLPTVSDLREMTDVLQTHKETALKSFDVKKALRIQTEIDEIQTQIDEEEKYLRRKSFSKTSCTICGANFETKTKMVGILKQKEMVCDNCRVFREV